MSIELKEFLLTEVPVGTLVYFMDGNRHVGATYVDSEDLFIESLDYQFLWRNVVDFCHHPTEPKTIIVQLSNYEDGEE